MRPDDFAFFRNFIQTRSGLALDQDKGYLVQSRLIPLLKTAGLKDLSELMLTLRRDPHGQLARQCVDAMATHESFFFRDTSPFEQIEKHILPELYKTKGAGSPIRVWSAACSSGQEPYSLAMLAIEQRMKLPGLNLEILATDISEPILSKARSALYSDFEVRRGLSEERRVKFLTAEGSAWRISDQVRSMVSFRHHNLLEPMSGKGPFDLILCRNVLIYFDLEMKIRVLNQLAKVLAPHGVIMLGSAETVVGLNTRLEPHPNLRGVFRHQQIAGLRQTA